LAETSKTPVALLTGFLGSGKTTLLAHLLLDPALGETAVIVNELGAISIDHHLLRRVDERTVLLGNGCVCCTLRGDLTDELLDLHGKRQRGEVPPFRRVIVETTGLADPAPILYTLASESVVKNHFELDRVIATVDAVTGLREPESLRQAAAADRLIVTKTDLRDGAALSRRLVRLNPTAEVMEASFGEVSVAQLFGGEAFPREFPARSESHRHGDVQAHALVFAEPLDWTAFGVWLTMLLAARGTDVLRVKGLLNVGGDGPLLLNGVQHVVHPPVHLDAWPDDDRSSRIVFIGRGFERRSLEESLAAFVRAARQ